MTAHIIKMAPRVTCQTLRGVIKRRLPAINKGKTHLIISEPKMNSNVNNGEVATLDVIKR
jgi:hypothetical protein